MLLAPLLMVAVFNGLTSEAVEWGRAQFSYSPRPVYYVENASKRLVIYHGSSRECDLVGDPKAVSNHLRGLNASSAAVVELSKPKMSMLIDRCERVHAQLFSRDPEAYFYVSTNDGHSVQWDRSGGLPATSANEVVTSTEAKSTTQSLWSLNMFNRVLIFPGTKWCGQGSVAEHYGDIGYHAEADRCCRYVGRTRKWPKGPNPHIFRAGSELACDRLFTTTI